MKKWHNAGGLTPKSFTCGRCGKIVASAEGFFAGDQQQRHIYICSNCYRPTYFAEDQTTQLPGVAPGNEIDHLPTDVEKLYREARNCVAIGSYTSAVLSCRKLLIHIAVAQKAPENQSFVQYVEYLADKGYVPPNGRGWVDHIRKKGNEANHEIQLMTKTHAEELILFLEMLLKFIYEFPQRVPKSGQP